MTLAAALLLVLGVLLAEPVPRLLARAGWPERAPRPALVLWQAIGLAAGLAAIGAGVVYGVAPLGDSMPAGLWALAVHGWHGRPFAGLGAGRVVALLAAAALALRLLGVLVLSTARTLRERRRHRALVDLVGTPWPDLGGARVLDHPDAVAYCLPGLRSRVVLSAGVLTLLDADELAAVLAHERAHLAERHDLVVLPFVAWGAALPFVRGVRRAQAAVAGLVEMVADDRARAVADPAALAAAIARLGYAGAPRGALSATGSAVLTRVARLLDPPPPVPVWLPAAALAAAALLVLLPTALLLAPALA
jgi:Zn-dependent protease with chaperone function